MSSLWLSLGSPLFRRAPAEAMLVGGLCGVVGVHVLLRRLAFFTHAAAHAAFPGVVAASLLGVSLLAGGAAGALALVAITSGISSFRRLGHAHGHRHRPGRSLRHRGPPAHQPARELQGP